MITPTVPPAGERPWRILDVACGGSRYLRDGIDAQPLRRIRATLSDQDPAALAFVQSLLPADQRRDCVIVCAPVRKLAGILRPDRDDRFDVVISTGLFDYLDDASASGLLARMTALTRAGGTVAISNFSPLDRSRTVKDWVSDWPLIYRTDREVAALFPAELTPHTSRSPDGGLVYGWATRSIPDASPDWTRQCPTSLHTSRSMTSPSPARRSIAPPPRRPPAKTWRRATRLGSPSAARAAWRPPIAMPIWRRCSCPPPR